MSGDDGRRIVVIGGGGHAKVVLDVLQAAGCDVVGFCDPSRRVGESIGTARCIGDDDALSGILASGVKSAIVALGDNTLRDRVARQITELGFELVNAVHPSAQISPSVTLGRGIAIMPGVVINADSIIGDNAIINTSASIDHDCKIGSSAHIAPGAHLSGYVIAGERVLIGVGCSIGRGKTLNIGDDAIIGTGSVVVHDVPPHSVVAGNPARPLAGNQASRLSSSDPRH